MRPKNFSVSFKKPAHADTVPITCSHCKLKNKLHFGPSDISKQFAKWNCSSCKTELVKLSVQSTKAATIDWGVVPNSIKAKSREIQNNPTAYIIGKLVRKNWKILTTIAVCLLIWANISGSGLQTVNQNSSESWIRSQENVYRGTQIARQEFIKYSKPERLRIQKFLKENFGYNSTIDGLWGKNTASSYLRAANRYVNGKSLYSVNNVNVVFRTALAKQKVTPRIETSNSQKSNNQTSKQLETVIENILMLGAAKALLGNGNSSPKKFVPIFKNNGPSYSYGNNGNTIYNPGGNSKFSYGSNGAVYYNPGSCPVKPCN